MAKKQLTPLESKKPDEGGEWQGPSWLDQLAWTWFRRPQGGSETAPRKWIPRISQYWQSPSPLGPEVPPGVIPVNQSPWLAYFKALGMDTTSFEDMPTDQFNMMAPVILDQFNKNREFTWGQQQTEQSQKSQRAMAEAKAAEVGYNQNWLAGMQAERQRIAEKTPIGAERAQLNAQQMGLWADQARMELENRTWSFEKLRNEIMSSAAPRDWVIKEKARLAVNPYAVALTRFTGYQGMGEGGPVERNPFMGQIPSSGEPRYYTGAPEVPTDVQQFLNQQNRTFGAPIETPSGQQWAAAPWTTQQKLIGYGEAIGTPEADLLGNIQKLLPNNPTRGMNWMPARAR